MPRPPCCTLMFLALVSWRLHLAGEDELQDRHGERNHSHADDCPGSNNRSGSALMPVVGFQNHDIGGWRQNP